MSLGTLLRAFYMLLCILSVYSVTFICIGHGYISNPGLDIKTNKQNCKRSVHTFDKNKCIWIFVDILFCPQKKNIY